MKRSWLIGAALVLSLSAVACSDDNDEPNNPGHDGSVPDASTPRSDAGMTPGMDGGASDGGSMDASVMDAMTTPVSDAGHSDAGDAH